MITGIYGGVIKSGLEACATKFGLGFGLGRVVVERRFERVAGGG